MVQLRRRDVPLRSPLARSGHRCRSRQDERFQREAGRNTRAVAGKHFSPSTMLLNLDGLMAHRAQGSSSIRNAVGSKGSPPRTSQVSPQTQRPAWRFGPARISPRLVSPAGYLPVAHTRFRIFIRHHNIVCSARSGLGDEQRTPKVIRCRSMQDGGCQLPRIHLPRTPANKVKRGKHLLR